MQAPEDSTEAWILAAQKGYVAEGDIRASSDGVLFGLHDTTVDRTLPPNTGAITAFTAAALDAMLYNQYNSVGYAAAKASRFNDMIDGIAANNGWMAPEIEVTNLAGAQAVVAALKAKNQLHRAIVQMFEAAPYTVLAQIAADNPGINLLVAFNTGSAQPSFATIAAAGIKYVGMDVTDAWVTRAVFDSGHALGLKFVPYVVDSLANLAIAQAAGADHIFTNRPEFMVRGKLDAPKPFNETWTGQSKWMWGDDWVIDGANLPSVNSPRPFNGEVGMPTALNNVVGAYCQARPLPLAAQSYQLDFNVILRVANGDATRYGAIQFALQQDGLVKAFAPVSAGFNGYGLVFRQNGAFSIDKYVALAASTTIAGPGAAVPFVVGTPVPFRLTVTPTQLTLLRVDTAASITVADNAFRAGILGFIWGSSGMYFGPVTGINIP